MITSNMASENFAELLNKLKQIHEKEVQGLQTKLNELTNEKCRDTQRIEELCAKNHQLREQQKVLKENVKVLENRLRAGLCDRCQVTQELAKKKQHEFGKAHFQSLQHIFILTNEMNKLRQENKSLKEDLRLPCSLEDRPKPSKGPAREGSVTPDSVLPLRPLWSRKASNEKTASQDAEGEGYQEPLSYLLGEDQNPEQRCSPATRISPSLILQGDHAVEKTPQKIANQLHGTIALVRPGARPGSQEPEGTANTSPPPVSKTPPPSPQPERSPSCEAYLRASKSDCHEVAPSYEALKLATRKEQICLLNQHFALHQLGLQNSVGRGSRFPHHLLMAREVGGRADLPDEWDTQAAILEFPGAMLYLKDHPLENRIQFLSRQEKFQYLLWQQQEFKARMEGNCNLTQERSSSPYPKEDKECKNERPYSEDPAEETLGKWLCINREDLRQTEKAESTKEYLTEAPLDLSDYGRGRENLKPTTWQQFTTDREAGSPDKDEDDETPGLLPQTCFSSQLHTAKHLHVSKEREQAATKDREAVVPPSLIPSIQEHPVSKKTLRRTAADREMMISFETERRETDQSAKGDSGSTKEESDEPDTSDNEATGTSDVDSLQGASVTVKYNQTKENSQGLQNKRKREQETWTKATKMSAKVGKNGKATQVPADPQEATKEIAFNHKDTFEKT